MAQLELDIKPNDELAKSAWEAADALDAVAAKEQAVNGLAKDIGKNYAVAATQAEKASKAVAGGHDAKGNDKACDCGTSKSKPADAKKEDDAKKKQREAEKKRDKERIKAVKDFSLGMAGAVAAAAGLGAALALAAKSAGETRKESAALVSAFSGNNGTKNLAALDTLAKNLGVSVNDVRAQFVEFRQMRLDNKFSAQLIKMKADLMATGLSAEAAGKEISYITSAADGVYNVAAKRRLAEVAKAYGGIGSGAAAAAYNARSLAGAESKIGNAVSDKLAKLWERIGPAIGKAANRLADFLVDALESEEGKKAIEAIGDAFEFIADAVNSENLTTGLNVIKALGVAVATIFEVAGKAIAYSAVKVVEAVDWINDKLGKLIDDAVDFWFPAGAALVSGLIDGITSMAGKAVDTVVDFAKGIAKSFAEELGIKSPSKVFAEYGKNTVEGYAKGEQQALASSGGMPLEEAAKRAPDMGAITAAVRGQSGGGSKSITIEQLIVQGGNGSPEDIARAVRYELQQLLMLGELSRGMA